MLFVYIFSLIYDISNAPASVTVSLNAVPFGEYIIIPPPTVWTSNSFKDAVFAIAAVTPFPIAVEPTAVVKVSAPKDVQSAWDVCALKPKATPFSDPPKLW
mgnify:CR=1 FL=1